ncbi:MAG: formyltransferase family protein [bacterium]
MSNIYINFFGSSGFVVEILKNICQNETNELAVIFDEQLLWLKKNYPDLQVIPQAWLSLDTATFKQKYPKLDNLTIKTGLVVSQPDRENRGRIISNPVVEFARENSLKLFTPEKINQDLEKYVGFSNRDSISVVASFGQIISQKILDSNNFGFINWHPSLLPKYRGPTPMQSALAAGDRTSGLSWIEVGAKMDSGKILIQIEQGLESEQTILGLQKQMQELGKNTWALAVVANITKEDTLNFIQNEEEVVFCNKLAKEDAIINLTKNTAAQVINHWRAYLEYPGTVFVDNVRFKSLVKLAQISTETEVLINQPLYDDGIWVQTKKNKKLQSYIKCLNDSYVQVYKIRLEGGKEIDLAGFSF